MADDKPIPASASNDGSQGIRNLDDSTPPANLIAAAATGGGGGGTPPPGTAIGVQPYNLDRTRRGIAYFLLAIMTGIIVAVVAIAFIYSIGCWLGGDCVRAESALQLLVTTISPLFTAMVGLVGSVVGFYFGSRQS